MSAGAVFQIISNDGKADKMIMATDLLEMRIKEIREENKQRAISEGLNPDEQDLDPSLAEIAETHIIHYQSKFKPFVAIGMEYQRLVPQSGGGGVFGGQVTFSLAQFGDFFTDMALNVNVGKTSCKSAPLATSMFQLGSDTFAGTQFPETPGAQTGVQRILTLPNGEKLPMYSEKAIRYAKCATDQANVLYCHDESGNIVKIGENVADSVYYCDFPGERMFKEIKFDINGNPLDEYDTYSYVFYRNFKLKEDKRVGYYRCVGQELPVKIAYQKNADHRLGGYLLSGLQTPKKEQPEFQIWQKLLFWFNLDFSLALPSAAIPFGQRFIKITFENVDKLVFSAASVYQQIVLKESIYKDATVTFPGGIPSWSGSQEVRQTLYKTLFLPVKTGGAIEYPTIKDMSLYVNNIFTHPAIHDLYIKRIGFYLVRVHRLQKQAVNQKDLNLLMNSFKYPIEYIYLGIIPDENTSGSFQSTDWHQFTKISHQYRPNTASADDYVPLIADGYEWSNKERTIDQIEVTAHGVSLFQKIDHRFYNQYKPGVFGQNTIVTPQDEGLALINFALFPGVFQPSGHINVSRAREFYIHVYSSNIGSPSTDGTYIQSGQLITEASALNFLLISDGSAVLRYST